MTTTESILRDIAGLAWDRLRHRDTAPYSITVLPPYVLVRAGADVNPAAAARLIYELLAPAGETDAAAIFAELQYIIRHEGINREAAE